LPKLIDNQELIGKNSTDQEIASARELIPYICFYNGLSILSTQKPPKDLL
jgi:hypothetical protein